jgi:hypothetical protein
MMRRSWIPLALSACLLLPACDDFQEFEVQNPCSFDVNVAFAGASPPPDTTPWPYPEVIPALSEEHVTIGAPAGSYPREELVQIRAPGHRTTVATIIVTQDDFTWRIPDSFCGR